MAVVAGEVTTPGVYFYASAAGVLEWTGHLSLLRQTMRYPFSFAAVGAALLLFAFNTPDCITGKGAVIKRSLPLQPVHAITLQGSLDVQLTQGEGQSVEVEAQENLVDLVETTVKDGHWTIRTRECYRTDKPFAVHLRVPKVDRVTVQGSGDVVGTGTFTGNSFNLDVQGSGNLKINVNGGSVKTSVQGSGAVKVSGTCDDLAATVQGSGDVKAGELKAGRARVNVMGSGDITVQTNGALEGDIMGSGDVEYLGSPSPLSVQVTGSGRVAPASTK
jgi:hypothetical protein